jgi:hypothetical protein
MRTRLKSTRLNYRAEYAVLAVRNHGDHNRAVCTFHWRQLQSTDVTSQQPSGCIDHHVTWGYLRYHLQTCCQACHTGWHHHMTRPQGHYLQICLNGMCPLRAPQSKSTFDDRSTCAGTSFILPTQSLVHLALIRHPLLDRRNG